MIKDSNYNIVQLGIGKYTKVYSMELDTGKKLAVKVLKPKFEKNKFYQDLLVKQARVNMQIQHPNIRKVYDVVYDDDDNTYQVMMEYLEGYNMQEYIENFGNIPAAQVEQWLKRILPAFIEVHRKGLVHGHIKPGNLVITPKGDLKVCDFAGPLFENELFPEEVEGDDILYLSPEQIQQIGPITALTDIYSLGVTLYTLLSGKDPYEIKDVNADTTRLRILNDPLPFIENISLKLNSLIQSCTAKNPKERFPMMESILFELDGGEFKRKSEIVEDDLFSTIPDQSNPPIAIDDISVEGDHTSLSSDAEIQAKDEKPPTFEPELTPTVVNATKEISSHEEPHQPAITFPKPTQQEAYEKADNTRVVITPPEIATEKQDEQQETETKATLEERAQAVWDRLGVKKDNDEGPKVTIVPVVKSVDEFVVNNKQQKKDKSQASQEAVKTSASEEIKGTPSPEPVKIPEPDKKQPIDQTGVQNIATSNAPEKPVIEASTVEVEPMESPEVAVEKSKIEASQPLDMPPAGQRKSSAWIWPLTALVVLLVGGYYGYDYWQQWNGAENNIPVQATIIDDHVDEGLIVPETNQELTLTAMDSLIDADSVANSLLLLEQAKLEQLKLQEAEKIRLEEARKAQELANAIDKTKIELQGPYIANIAPFKYNGLIGFIDRNGQVLIKPVYTEILTFNGGLAAVKNTSNLWGFVNTEGKEVIRPQYKEIFGFSKGLAGAMKDGKWGFINTKGTTVVPFSYDIITDFNDNLAGVRRGGKWGFVNTKGTEAIACQYDNAWSFRDGLAGVEKGGKWGFINKSGVAVIPVKYNQVNNFAEGLACVEFNGKFGYIDKAGNEIVDFIYDAAKPFTNGTARVFDGSKWIYINKLGKCVRDCN